MKDISSKQINEWIEEIKKEGDEAFFSNTMAVPSHEISEIESRLRFLEDYRKQTGRFYRYSDKESAQIFVKALRFSSVGIGLNNEFWEKIFDILYN